MHSILSALNRLLSRNKLSILIYHQVLEEFDHMRPDEVTANNFDWQMSLISRYFTPVSLSDAAKHLGNNTLPANAICVTFDDGYLSNLTVVQLILEKYQVPATVYVATAFTEGADMWNDRALDLFCSRNLDTRRRNRQFRRLADSLSGSQSTTYAVEIGGHTVNHPILKVLTKEQQLEDWTAKNVKHFAYPNGSCGKDLTDETIELAKKAGYETAVVTDWGTSRLLDNLLRLKRFTFWDKSAIKFHVR